MYNTTKQQQQQQQQQHKVSVRRRTEFKRTPQPMHLSKETS